ncbi:MAG: polynucleotide adenylyltransferase [Deltaproteobacteria bacterium]|nr:MAG: polynucleotide adenylyltransferase [Deltaproteobacteria bacterium]
MASHNRSISMEIPKFVNFVLERLRHKGLLAFIVGGAVRDALLGRPQEDWDIATSASPSQIQDIFSDTRQFQLKHETITLIMDNHKLEVTTFRGKHANNLHEDLSRRDFTIDAMAFDPNERRLIDPFGGQADLAKRRIKAVENPEDRFKEDPLRLIRAVRLATELGFQVDPETFTAIQKMAGSLAKVAKERIRDEMVKILVAQRPSSGLHLLRRTGLLRVIIPELLEGYLKRQNRYHRFTILKHIMVTVDTVAPTLTLRLTALLHDIAKPRVRSKGKAGWRFIGHEKASAEMADHILQRLRFSSELIRKVTHLIAHHMIGYSPKWTDSAVRRWVRKIGIENVDILIDFRKADLIAHGTGKADLGLLEELRQRASLLIRDKKSVFSTKDLAIDGHTIMKVLNIPSGPEVGKVLQKLMALVTEHPEFNTQDQLVDILKRMSCSQ